MNGTIGSANGSHVVVVGAGIVGASTAYHLAAKGCPVTLIERGYPASGPTGKSSAILHAFYLLPELSQLAARGGDFLKRLPEIAGQGSFVSEVGMMWVCGESAAPEWRAAAARINAEGSRIDVLSPADFAASAPNFIAEDVSLGLWEPAFGYADAYGATNAIAKAAVAAGARLIQNADVQEVVTSGERVDGVLLSDGRRISADRVVLAAGPWTRRLLATIGLDLPLSIERHPMAVLEAGGRAREIMPFAWCDDILCNYARPDNDGVVLAGSWAGGGTGVRHASAERPRFVENPDDYMEGVDEDESVAIVETFAHRVPAMMELGIRPGYAGLYDMSPDDLPVIGEMPGVEGLIVAAGSSGHGFKTGPAVGEAIAALILDGPQPILAPFSPARFVKAA